MKALKILSYLGKIAGVITALDAIPYADPNLGILIFAAVVNRIVGCPCFLCPSSRWPNTIPIKANGDDLCVHSESGRDGL